MTTKTLYRFGLPRKVTIVTERPSIEQDPHTQQYRFGYCGRYTESKESSTQVALQPEAFQWDVYKESRADNYLAIHKDAP